MADGQAVTPEQLAERTGCNARLVREWLSAQAGERRLRHVFAQAGFSHFRRATETPFNRVLEVRK